MSKRGAALALAAGLSAGAQGCAAATEPATAQTRAPQSRVSPQLASLYRAYEAARRDGSSFPPNDVSARLAEDRVVIDATAESDVRALEVDLVQLGMERATAFGRVVSGELPLAAIPSLANLDSLRYAVVASPSRHGAPERSPGLRPTY